MSTELSKLNLGLSKVNDFIYNSNNLSIRKYYNFNGNINYYSPNFNLFTNYFNDNLQFNNKYKLVRLYKRKNRIKTIGYFYKALIKSNNKTFFQDIFIKEIPIVTANMTQILDMNISNSITPINYKYSSMLYDNSSCVNVEIFVTYLLSKLVENGFSPAFLKYYGCFSVTMNKYTYLVGDNEELQEMGLNENNCSIFFKEDDVYLEVYNMPTYLLSIEKAHVDIDEIKHNFSNNVNFLISITFQLFAAIFTMYNILGIKHNDLHLGNIMFNRTNKTHIYYNVDGSIYKVPTFGFEAKIIDWGRSTYDFNGIKGKNSIFNIDGECFGQYIYKKLGSCKHPIEFDFNKYSDIVMLAHNLLFDFVKQRNTKWGRYLKNLIININGEMNNYTKFDWSIYKNINQNKFNIRPRNVIKNKIFSNFIIKENDENLDNIKIFQVVLDRINY